MTQRRSVIERIIKRIIVAEGNRLEIEFYTDGISYQKSLSRSSVTEEEESSEYLQNGGLEPPLPNSLLLLN